MKNKKEHTCYVFSQTTLDLALEEWTHSETQKGDGKKEALQITVVALPWFLAHLKQNSPIYMFSYSDLIDEMKNWQSLQLTTFPKQKKRIKETCHLLLNFFNSDAVIKHKMIIKT